MKNTRRGIIAVAGALALASWASQATADEPEPSERSITQPPRPNAWMLKTGLVIFGLSYGAAAVVAIESSRDGDGHLWIPLAGPWLDLANRRPTCPAGRAPECRGDTLNQVALAIDGALQAIGAFGIVGAFLAAPTEMDRRGTAKTHIRIAPWAMSSAYGLAAAGFF